MRRITPFLLLFLLFFCCVRASAQSGIITTIAGNGTAGFSGDGGPATAAQLNNPTDVRKDAAGNIYIADNDNHRIRKITPAGIISTIAGTGVAGYSGDGGLAISAKLKNPDAVAVDAAGNVYIADLGNDRIRKINTAGIISTIAGTGTGGFSGDGGPAIAARINNPAGVAVDLAGNVYISDRGNDRVRKVNTAGIISTIGGGGATPYTVDGVPATSVSLCGQNYVSVDNAGTVYITNTGCWHFMKISPAGLIYNVAGDVSPAFSGDCGPATAADIQSPQGICPDNLGNIFLAPKGNKRIRSINSLEYIKTIAGTGAVGYTGDGGPAMNARFSSELAGLYADLAGNIYVADAGNHAIRHFTTTVFVDSYSVCMGGTVVLSSSTSSGTWVSANTTVATVVATGPTIGTATGVSGGSTTITFSNIACPDLFFVRVDTFPSLGTVTMCSGSTITLSSGSLASGTWTSSNSSVATVDNGSGVVSGVSGGVANVTYTTSGGCYTTVPITVTPMPSAITGSLTVCVAATTVLSNTVAGGTWSSASSATATVSSGGVVTGVSAGTAVISYATSGLCWATTTVTVNPLPVSGNISGPLSVCGQASIALSNSVTGGTWSSSSTSIATVSAAGVVTGGVAGAVTISYTVANSCGTASSTLGITVVHSDTTRFGHDSDKCASVGTITLNAPAGYTTYSWSTGNTLASISVSTSGTYISYSRSGCSTRIDTFIVAFHTMPVVNLGNDTSFCNGNTVTLSSAQPPGSAYVWSTGAVGPSIVVGATGTYWLQVTNTFGCSTTDTIVISVYNPTTVSLGHDTVNCHGGPVVLQSSILYPPTATYLWNTGATTPTYSVTTTGLYYLTVSLGSCTSVADSIFVTIFYDTFHLYTRDTMICKGSSIVVSATANPMLTVQWLPTTGIPVSNVLTPVITPDTSATYVIRGVFPMCPDIVDSLHIDVQPNPVVDVGLYRHVCSNDTLHLHARVTPGWYSGYIYSWQPSASFDLASLGDVTYYPTDTTQITLTVTTPAGCSGSDSTMIFMHESELAVLDTLIRICPRDSIQLKPVLTDTTVSFTWLPQMYIRDAGASAPLIFPVTSQDYIGIATNIYGCSDTVKASVIVSPGAVLFLPDSVIIYPGESYHIAPQTNCTYFAWTPTIGLDNAHIADPLTITDVSTQYFVTARTEYGCSVRDSIKIYVDDGSAIDIPNAFTPSGANPIFRAWCKGISSLNYFRIFNRWGNVVFETNDIDAGWDGTYKGTLQPMGVYMYQIQAVTRTGKTVERHGNVTLLR